MNAYVLLRVLCTLSAITFVSACEGADDGRPDDDVWDPGTDEAEPVVEDDGGGGGGDSSGGDSGGGDDGGAEGEVSPCGAPTSACSGWNGTPPRVELRIFDLDDVVVAEVNGLRRGFYSIPNTPSRDTGRMDVTHWFSRGSNDLRILAANTGGPADVAVELWIDGVVQQSTACGDATCDGSELPLGVFLDQAFDVSSENFPCAQQVCVHSEDEGQIYVDGVYTPNRTPAALMLPAGGWFSIGVGSGTEDPPADAGESFVHEGRMRTETIWVPDEPMDLDMTNAALATPSNYRFLIVPIHGVAYTNGDVGILPDDAASNLVPAIEATSANKVMPFTYGQASWSAEIHPTIEMNAVLDANGFLPIDRPAMIAAGLDQSRVDAANVTIWLYSTVDAHGQPVSAAPCCWWGGGGANEIWIPSNGTFDPTYAQYLLLHEWLHTLEDNLALAGYAGADGVHGSEEHAYHSGDNGEFDFAYYYRHWMRGRIPEAGTYVGAVTSLWLLGYYQAPLLPPSDLAAAVRRAEIDRAR